MRALVPLLSILAVVGVALIATSSRSASHASRGPVRIRATSAGTVAPEHGDRRDTIGTRADSAATPRRGPATRHQRHPR